MKRSGFRIAAIAGFVGIFPALVLAAVLVFEFSIPADGLRVRIATTVSDALGCPLTISGSLHLVTGRQPGIEGRDVRLEECRAIRVARASADRVRVRASLRALFSREIRLVEIAGERLEVEVPTGSPAPSTAPARTSSRWTFTEIRRLYITPARLLVRSASAPPRAFDFIEVEGSARVGKPMQLTLRGVREKETWEVTASTATMPDALAGLERWPLDFAGSYASATATLRGSWTPTPIGIEGDLTFASVAAERLLKALGANPQQLGKLELTARLAASRDRISLDAMQLASAIGAISGEARMTLQDDRPRISISLRADEIDYAALNRWRAVERGTGTPEETVTRMLSVLRSFDGELMASVERVTNAPFPATDLKYSSHLEAGRLEVATSAIIGGAPGESSLDVDARGPFALAGRASVKSLPRAAVARARDVAEIDPRIGGLSATFSARGETVKALLADMRAQVQGKDVKLALPLPGERREVRLRTVEIKAGRGEAMQAHAAGTLAGEPLELDLAGGPLVDLIEDKTWAVERLRARVGTARVQASGAIEQPRTAIAAKLAFDIAVSRLDQLAPLLGRAKLPRVPGSLRGSIDTGTDAWRVDATTLAIGATRGSGRAAGRRGAPTDISLEMETVAGDELAAIGESSSNATKDEPALALPDIDLSLKARRADYRGQAFENVAISAQVRDSVVRGPFSLDWSGARVEGKLNASFGKDAMRFAGDVAARGLDLARMPGPLGKRGITGRIGRIAVRVETRGASSETLAANAAISVNATDASLILPKSYAFPEGARVTFAGEVQAPGAAPIDFSLKGALGDKPFAASGQLPALDALFPKGRPHAVRLVVDYDRTRLEAAGNATIDKDVPRFSGTLNLSGDTLHTLAELAGFSLPPLGPYKVSATVDADADQVKAHDLAMRLGKSEFRAALAAETRKTRPRFAAKVRGLPVHLEDIGAQAWIPGNVEKRAVEESRSGEQIDQATLDRDARVLTEILRAFDLDLDVTFDEVSSAGEVVGRAEINAQLDKGRLAVKPASLWLGQGKFRAEIEVDARGKVPQYAVKFEGSAFDYGPLMRAVDPKSPFEGILDLSMDIKTFGVPETLKQNATGALDVLILPKDQQAGSLDLLGAGVLRLIIRTLDPRSQSRVNCVVGSFDLDKGVATSRIVLLDTTLARVAGELVVDYRTQALKGRFAPRSKQPQLFSVAPGITVGGTLDEPDIGVSPQSILFSALRIWQFPVAFASDWLTNEKMPADGTPECRAAYRHVLH